MKIRVQLTLLDKTLAAGQPVVYEELMRVAIAGKTYEIIGLGSVHMRSDGSHYSELDLEKEPNGDLYFYYNTAISEHPTFWLTGIQLNEKMIPNNPTTQLKEMILD